MLKIKSTKDLINLTPEQKADGVWFSGKPGDGEYKEWWPDGQLRVHSFWRNSRRHGDRKYWSEDGKIWEYTFWEDGKRIKNFLK